MPLVEAAEKKAKGSWIHVETMTALDCLPGNCVSCDDATKLLNKTVQLLNKSGPLRQNRMNLAPNASKMKPPATAVCDWVNGNISKTTKCLEWQPQVIGTCCRIGHHGTLCAYCDEGWAKAKGLCMPCQFFDYPKLALVVLFYLGLCLFFCRKATRLKKPGDVDENGQSSFIGIMTFFLQTVPLPPLPSDPSRYRLAMRDPHEASSELSSECAWRA